MDIISTLAWLSQICLAFLFYRSAYRKVTKFELVKEEFLCWGYPFPGQVTFFLIVIWILAGAALLIPQWAGFSALVLAFFMLVAFITLLMHGEYRRLIEPTRPLLLSIFIVAVRSGDMINVVESIW